MEKGMVTVHHFEVWDINRGDWVREPFKSTAERIREEAKGRIIPGTAEKVDPSELDVHGRFDPRQPKK
jgi:hypothetical protein